MIAPNTMGRRGALAALLGLAASSCANLYSGLAPTPRTMKSGGMPHAWQAASFIFGFAQGSTMVWQKSLDALDEHGVPLLEHLRDKKSRMDLSTKEFDDNGRSAVTAYEVALTITDKHGKSYTLPGKPGTDEAAYDAALAPAAAAAGVDPELLKQGHFAFYAIANHMTELNASHDSLSKLAFKLLVLRAKIAAGEKNVDWFDPARPASESLEDIDLSLRLIEDDHQRTTRERAGVLALLALVDSYRTQGATDLLREQIASDKEHAQKWLATHHRPTAGEYGVEPATLPSPASITAQIQKKVGFIGSLAKLAYGVATANPGKTVQALAELAPEDSTAKTALDGLSAALGGDVKGTLEAIAKLSGHGDIAKDAEARIGQLQKLRGDVTDAVHRIP